MVFVSYITGMIYCACAVFAIYQ